MICMNRHIVRCFILNDNGAQLQSELSDEELIGRFRSGDEYSFELIAARYLGLISAAALRYRGALPDIDESDLVQEGLLALLSACERYDKNGGSSFKNYLMRCVKHRYISLYRHATGKKSVPAQNIVSIEEEEDVEFVPDPIAPDELLEAKEQREQIRRQLKDRLSDLEYKVAILHLSGYARKEIADRLNVSLKTIDNAQTRIRQKLSR